MDDWNGSMPSPNSWSIPSSDTDLPPIMAPDNPHEDDDGRMLSKGMSKYFATGEFSDMKIKCGATVHAVHRIVVCSQSPFFTNAMNQEHGFKEAQTNTVELNDDHPVTVKAMLDYMYLEKYSDLGFGDKLEERISLHIDVYAIADRLSVGGLRRHAADNLGTLMFTEKVSPELLAGIIGNAYDKTPENDRYLRPLMVRTVSGRIEQLIQDEDFMTLMESVQGFNPALVKMLVLEKPYHPCRRYTCHRCNEAHYLVLPDASRTQEWGAKEEANGMYCPGCSTYHSNDEWRRDSFFGW
ncbi:BTB/POZ-like protein [Lasiodiplodia theobromae]|nr:BTB/POZ-like protein [Lasiodiplodia theobromae]